MATQEAAPRHENTVTITDAGPSRKRIAIRIPAEAVNEQLGTSLDTLAVEADIPGFRRGRAPRRLVERKFGAVVRREAKNQLVASAYQQAVQEHKLRVLGDPVGEGLAAAELVDGQPLAFEVEVEVSPEFTLPSLEGIAVRKPMLEVTDEMVEQELTRLRTHEGDLQQQEAPAPGDYLTGHGQIVGPDEAVHLDIADAVIQVPPDGGSGMILGILVPDFGKQLGLPTPGQTVEITTTGPDNHENEALRGIPLTIRYTVARADRIVPASVADLAARYGLEDERALREALRERMVHRVRAEQNNALRQQVARHLLERTEMELPERITANQSGRNLARRRMELMHRGVPAEEIERNMAELRSASDEVAVRELKLFFILDRAAEDLGVKVTEAELNGWIAQMALSRGERPEKVRSEIIQRDQVGMVYQQVREHKAMEAILAKATVTEVPASEYAKLAGEESPGGAAGRAGGAPKGGSRKKGEASSGDAEEPPAAEKPAKKPRKKKDAEE
ncbi:MAG TPA: trigger factor [Phycisphaerales bacterium]|nr:trigger factor [Phycisphaerales bacterium]